jgi:hypothetical protein
MLSAGAIEKYRQLYLAEFGVELSTEQAAEQAERFLSVARVVLQPMPKRLLLRYIQLLAEQKNIPTAS